MLDFYTYATVNGQAVAIALAATRLPHQRHWVDLRHGEQRQPDFLAINPSGRIPVIVDQAHEPPLVVHQTGAILAYLAQKAGQFGGQNEREAAQVQAWLWFQLTDVSINFFNNFYLKSLTQPPQPAAANVLKQRAMGFYQEFDAQLQKQVYLVGEQMTIADMAAYPVVHAMADLLLDETKPHLSRWYAQMQAKEAVQSGMQAQAAGA
ncbi:glutathione S-transferase family protein [Marinicella meishanensis]|uniref:glutathione S-transferase family protein n=1 Tax=Marinicella meishanensis TaxID=2873263 RepID=UPI001CBBF6F1|nr:glutathione S-transferase [Marinicella sp. NBU2979]